MDVKVTKPKKGKTGTTAVDRPSGPPGSLEPLVSLRREIDNLFDSFFSRGPLGLSGWGLRPFEKLEERLAPAFMLHPRIDVSETETEYRVTAELPGLDESEIEISLSDGLLTLKGEKKDEREEKDRDYHLMERHYGSFRRSFPVPTTVDEDRIEASFDKGVLRIVMPKVPKRPARKIAVKPGEPKGAKK